MNVLLLLSLYLLLLYSYLDISLDVSNKQLKEHINKPISRQSNKQREYLPISAQADFVSVGEQINKKSKQKGPQIDNYINFS